jgi:tRNA (guanine-N7-)-methyltransferase
MRRLTIACRGRRFEAADVELPLPLEELVPGQGPWEVEVGFGKGRYLLARAAAEPATRLLGVEMAARYFRLVERRLSRRRLANALLVLGEALYVFSTVLPSGFARAVHVYFPDPWPKERHHKRRLFDSDSVDLLLRLLRPGGELLFATDSPAYGAGVEALLRSHPALAVEAVPAWPAGARTNYEAKYECQGRPIRRLVARLRPVESLVHPAGLAALAVGPRDGEVAPS